MRTYYIYKFTNSVNNKIYVGQCSNPKQRPISHKSAAKVNSDACPLFYNALRHHGYENFKFEIIETIYTDQKGIDDREIFWIAELNARDVNIGYNLSKGGGGRGLDCNTDTHKKCPRCDEVKLRTEFNSNISCHDGIQFCCRDCYNKIQQAYMASLSDDEKERRRILRRENYAKDPTKHIEAVKIRYEENKEEIKEYQKQYRVDNKEIISEKHKEYRDAHREEISQNSKNTR